MDQLFVNMPSSIHAPPQTPLPMLSHANPPSWSATVGVLDQDEYDDDIADLPQSPSGKKDKQVRRRSSKACDQCRKSKCKCERPGSRDEPCKNCILLGTPCTFLGPSRKRGPPKGYIDAIESRLHQMEALMGTLLSSADPRVRSILNDLASDQLARDILQRVDESPFGTRGGSATGQPIMEDRAARILRTSVPVTNSNTPAPYASPSVEWQDYLKEKLKKGAEKWAEKLGVEFPEDEDEEEDIGDVSMNGTSKAAKPTQKAINGPPKLSVNTTLRRTSHPSLAALSSQAQDRGESPRQRRRIDSSSPQHPPASAHSHLINTPSLSPSASSPPTNHSHLRHRSSHTTSSSSDTDSSDRELLATAVGQLSLNEDSQVRYHSPLSGLHILNQNSRLDKRNEGGLWRFPKAGVWPKASRPRRGEGRVEEEEWEVRRSVMPAVEEQEVLLGLYFGYVHPVVPVLDEEAFWRAFRGEPEPEPSSSSPPASNSNLNASPPAPGECRVPALLLLAMFAIAARYKHEPADPVPISVTEMWNAGDEYLEGAKRILNLTYASSRPTTCQALLLLSYREIGIGAMAQAWLYVGMAVRMAQDLGMHRSADRWQHTGGELFSELEKQVRKKIWYTCVIMDKYVSTYIGRPLSIFERDFDTALPAEEPIEEMKPWLRHNSMGAGGDVNDAELPSMYLPVPCRPVACFNACARLSGILSGIVESIYAVNPPASTSSSSITPAPSRHALCAILEKRLDKWYLELPEYLRVPNVSPGANGSVSGENGVGVGGPGSVKFPPPHVMTLHMMYWCSVLLLHRPFIRRKPQSQCNAYSPNDKDNSANPNSAKEKDTAAAEAEKASCLKAFDLCAMAATKISNLVGLYKENFCLRRAPAFLTYYIFSAGIMHMTTLSVRQGDVQAGMGLQQCMDALQTMNTLWPSAGRAWELLHGAKVDMRQVELSRQVNGRNRSSDKRKRNREVVIDVDADVEDEDGGREDVRMTQVPTQVPSQSQQSPGYTHTHPHAHTNGVDAGVGILRPIIQHQTVTPPLASLHSHQLNPAPASQQQQSYPHAHGLPHPHPHTLSSVQPHVPSHSHSHSHSQSQSQMHPTHSNPNPYNLPPPTFQSTWASGPSPPDFTSASNNPSTSNPSYPSSSTTSSTELTYASFDSPKADLWKDFPEQFGVGDPSLITSSLYGLPVMHGAGGMHHPGPGQQQQGHGGHVGQNGHGGHGMGGFMGDFSGMYNE